MALLMEISSSDSMSVYGTRVIFNTLAIMSIFIRLMMQDGMPTIRKCHST